MGRDHPDEKEALSLKDACQIGLEEARTVVPGIQALFGFQLIAVFNERFDEALSGPAKAIHLAAVLLTALSCALLMTPAAYHRRAGGRHVSLTLHRIISRFIHSAMVALMIAISFAIYVITTVVFDQQPLALGLAIAALLVFAACWVWFPMRAQRD